MAVEGTVESSERQERLLASVSAKGSVRIRDAAVEFGVSEMTIRRDLDELERTHDIRRVRGGATSPGVRPFARRDKQNVAAKARIAQKLSGLVPVHGNIALDSSSTVMHLVPSLNLSTDQYVVTNGLRMVDALVAKGVGRPILTGGEPHRDDGLLQGPIACASARAFAYTRYFFSANAVDTGVGVTELTLDGAEIKKAFASTSGELVLAVDSSKLGGVSTAISFSLRQIDYLVTELDPSDSRLDGYRDLTELV